MIIGDACPLVARQFFATILVSCSSRDEFAGHSELGMTQRYMHLSPAALESAIELLDRRGNIAATPGVEISKSRI